MSFKKTNCKYVDEYINLVLNDELPHCRWELKLIKLVLRIFDEEDLFWDNEEIEKYMSYQKYFEYDLFPWEKFIFVLHNCIRDMDGLLRFPEVFIYVGRGSGKNGYLSYEDFCLLTPNNQVKNYSIDICANSEEQAMTSFLDIKMILDSNKDYFKKFFKWNKTEIRCLANNNTLKYRTSNAKTKDGLRTGKLGFDELHAYENYDMLNVMKTGLGKVKDSRITNISTNGNVRGGVLDDMLDKSHKILNGELKDYGFLPFLCCLESEEEVNNPLNWYKANPSLRYLKTLLKEIEREYQDYQLDSYKNLSFITKRMNFFKPPQEHLVATWDDILLTNKPINLKHKQNVIFGLDFSKTTDFVGTFILGKENNQYYGKQYSFFCTQSKDRQRIKAPLEEFAKRGQMEFVDDVEIPIDIIKDYIKTVQQEYNIIMLVIDNYRYSFVSRALKELGFTKDNNNLKMTRPSDIMSVTQKVNSVFINHTLSVGDDNLFRWFTNNTKLVPCKNNNYTYEKIEPKSRKNDGFMAFVNAMCCSDLLEEQSFELFKPIIL